MKCGQGRFGLCIGVGESGELKKESGLDGIESRGVAIVAKPKTHRDGARSCYVTDPDGNTIQIIHHPPISGKL